MVLNIPPDKWNKLSYRERRRLISKEKKRISRISVAKQQQLEQEEFEEYIKTDCGLQEQELAEKERQKEEAKRQLRHEEWLERERKAQEDFRQKKEREDTKLKEREERERIIREEWEEIERREREAEERKKGPSKQSKDHNILLEEALAGIDQTLESMDKREDKAIMPWHNPFAPVDKHSMTSHGSSASNGGRMPDVTVLEETQDPVRNYGTEKDKVNCPFYLKTGACRYGDTCSRHHPVPATSATLIIRGMYSHPALSQQYPDDQDAALEIDEGDLTQDYNEFYNDVLPELAECGKVVQFKVSRNFEAHLRGNVYVQFSSENECLAAVKVFNGRWYAGKQLSCQFCPVQRWRTAICGLYNRQECPKGKHCNFLHVFDNPEGAFSLDPDNWHQQTSPRRGNNHRQSSNSSSRRRRDSASPDRRRGGGNRGQRTDRHRSRSPVRRYDGRSRRREASPSRRYHSRRDRSYSRSRSPKQRRRDQSRSRSYSPALRKLSSGRRERRGNCSGGGSNDGSVSPSHKRSRHKKNKKKSKHRHKKQQQKRTRQTSDDDSSGSSDNGEVDQGMVDQVLRNVTVD